MKTTLVSLHAKIFSEDAWSVLFPKEMLQIILEYSVPTHFVQPTIEWYANLDSLPFGYPQFDELRRIFTTLQNQNYQPPFSVNGLENRPLHIALCAGFMAVSFVPDLTIRCELLKPERMVDYVKPGAFEVFMDLAQLKSSADQVMTVPSEFFLVFSAQNVTKGTTHGLPGGGSAFIPGGKSWVSFICTVDYDDNKIYNQWFSLENHLIRNFNIPDLPPEAHRSAQPLSS